MYGMLFFLCFSFFNLIVADMRILYGDYISYSDLSSISAKSKIQTKVSITAAFGNPTVKILVPGIGDIWFYYFIDFDYNTQHKNVLRYLKLVFKGQLLQSYDVFY